MSFFGFNKFGILWKTVQDAGGIRASLYKFYRMDELKMGKLIGTDKYGNRYLESPRFFFGRNRWVEYAPYYGLEYDGSQVPAEWYGWLHYKTDFPPHEDPVRPNYKWMLDHTENFSGTSKAYYPYSTTCPKIEPWIPPKSKTC